ASDTEGHGQFLFLLRIHFINIDLVTIFFSQFFKNRSYHFTGSAPICIEINQTRFISQIFPFFRIFFIIRHFFKKVSFSNMNSFLHFLAVSVPQEYPNMAESFMTNVTYRKKIFSKSQNSSIDSIYISASEHTSTAAVNHCL